jgi:hypothetical protein
MIHLTCYCAKAGKAEICSQAKCVADAVRCRDKMGLDVALEALGP